LRRWCRVLRSSLRCFFFAIRLRRFLMTEPITVTESFVRGASWAMPEEPDYRRGRRAPQSPCA
jgi:hypothetical protein